jgi:hypothetical protein
MKVLYKHMDWIILVQAIGRVLLVPKITQCICNTLIKVYYKSFGSITYLNNHGRVLHNPNKTYKERNTLVRIICKNYGLNYFGLGYWWGISSAHNYLMHV